MAAALTFLLLTRGLNAADVASCATVGCPARMHCEPSSATCVCNAGYFPLPSETGTKCNVEYNFGPAIGNGWRLVRRVRAGTAWHPVTDQLAGTVKYGTFVDNPTADATFSRTFDTEPFNQFLFATGDMAKWLIASKGSVLDGYYSNEARPIIASSTSLQPYSAKWYRRPSNPEDPWISCIDHHDAIDAGEIVYGEAEYDGPHGRNVLPMHIHNGANVFIRRKAVPRCIAKIPNSNPATIITAATGAVVTLNCQTGFVASPATMTCRDSGDFTTATCTRVKHNFGGAIGGGWVLVRRVQAGEAWHPATDQLTGTQAYGNFVPSPSATATFSRRFDEDRFDQFLFATGDQQKWLIATKTAVVGDWYFNAGRPIIASSTSLQPYSANWYRRQGNPEDPWVSCINHHDAIAAGEIVYGEAGYVGPHGQNVLPMHKGANVFIRSTAILECIAKIPRSKPETTIVAAIGAVVALNCQTGFVASPATMTCLDSGDFTTAACTKAPDAAGSSMVDDVTPPPAVTTSAPLQWQWIVLGTCLGAVVLATAGVVTWRVKARRAPSKQEAPFYDGVVVTLPSPTTAEASDWDMPEAALHNTPMVCTPDAAPMVHTMQENTD